MPWIPICIIAIMVSMALFAPLLAPYSPIDQTLRDKLIPPFWVDGGGIDHVLGTDAFGRDMLSRLIYGARVSLIVAALALTAGGGIGLLIGIVAGYFGGAVDNGLMRLVDAAFTFPAILFALLLAVTMGQGLSTFGRMCVSMMRAEEHPRTLASATKSRCFNDSTSPRITRAKLAHSNRLIARTNVPRP